MEGLEEKLGAVLNNPQMMQQLMSMVQNLTSQAPPQKQEAPQEPPSLLPDIDLSALQKISGMAKQSGIDKQQQALLNALCPYLSDQRIHKLDNAHIIAEAIYAMATK